MVRFMDTDEIKPDISGWKRISDHYMKGKLSGSPKMSVIIPSYNQGHTLEATIQSFIEQKNVDKELIIIDCGSQDHTLSLLEKYKAYISRIYYVARKNYPLMVNKGFALATGEYVSYLLPGVQYLNQHCLCHMSQVAFENRSPEVLFSGSYITEATFPTIKESLHKSTDDIEPFFHYYPFNKSWLKRGFIPSAPCSIWYKSEYIAKINGLRYDTASLKKTIFDLLCRIYQDKNVRAASTFWSTTSHDRRMQKRILNYKDYFTYFSVVAKYFGIVSAVLWFFRHKPTRIFAGLITKLRTFFKES